MITCIRAYSTFSQADKESCDWQLWLRDATELEFLRAYPRELNSPLILQRIQDLEERAAIYGNDRQQESKPFKSAYWWSWLTLWGDGIVGCGQIRVEKKKTYDYNAATERYVECQESEME